MDRVELRILYKENGDNKTRAIVNKWKFCDSVMGEQYLTFSIASEKPIDWAIGDFCVFRGETFTLNYIPSLTQKAKTGERQDAYTYENVKFDSVQEELTRCLMLDITPTTGTYVAALGTNYTGSSKFQLYCGEVLADQHIGDGGEIVGRTLTAVCALAAKIQANLDRMFPSSGWHVYVDTFTTYVNASGKTVLVTHTDDKVLTFDNTSVAKALSEVHNTFDLDYCVKGRNIYIGYNLNDLTSDDDDETFAFGYGKGYPTRDNSGTALFQIKRIANQQQNIVTRLRALGSTKNLPYRYYNKKYNLSQSLFPTNLQLPDTFEIPSVKDIHNAERDTVNGVNPQTNLPYLRHVKGDTNDAYIDKNDDAENCVEGVREESARWDGTGDLPEIYPTIEEATYSDLRSASVPDQDGRTGVSSFSGYSNSERVDKLLAVGYKDGNDLVDDANTGDGILPESESLSLGITRSASISLSRLTYMHKQYNATDRGDFTYDGEALAFIGKKERTLFSIQGVTAGNYAMAPTIGAVMYGFQFYSLPSGVSAYAGFIIKVKQKKLSNGETTTIATYRSGFEASTTGVKEMEMPELPDLANGVNNARVQQITVTELSDITVTFIPMVSISGELSDGYRIAFKYQIGNSRLDHSVTYAPEYTWIPLDDTDSVSETFHVFLQDMGFDITACWTDETPIVAMKSGRCVGREFEISQDVQRVYHRGKKGYMLTLKRATDSSLNTYYPSATDPIAEGDYFVLLNINMPDAYVKMAEVRLLRAATDYLADNCETQFTYQPYLDDIYLQRNYDNMVAAGTPEKSIFWRLYAGLKFTFLNRFSSADDEDDQLVAASISIQQVTITCGDGITPKVELTLNDELQQSALQKLSIAVDRIYNGSLFSSGANSSSGDNLALLRSLLQSEGSRLFLSRVSQDTALGKIIFNRGLSSMANVDVDGDITVSGNVDVENDVSAKNLEVSGDTTVNNLEVTGEEKVNTILPQSGNEVTIGNGSTVAKVEGHVSVEQGAEFKGNLTQHRKGLQVGVYTGNSILGTGAEIDENGNATVESLTARSFFSAPVYRFNRIEVTDGESWSTNGLGTIQEVTPISRTEGYISLHLSDGEYGSVAAGDICRGIYNEMAAGEVSGGVLINEDGTFDECGFMKRYGFFTSYFWIKEVTENQEGKCTFKYELRNSSTPHPCKFMKFAQYGSFTDTTRQSSSYENTHPAWYRAVYIGVNTWIVQPENISQLQGNIKGFTIKLRNGNYFTFDDRGLYIDKNIYFGEAITEIDPATIETLKDELEAYHVELDIAADTITVDPTGNVIGGLWIEETENNETYRKYRLHTAITAKKGEDYLVLGSNANDTGTGEYKIHVASADCDYMVDNGTVYITRIKNIKDQTAGTEDDLDFDYDAMRDMREVKVTIIVDCEGRGSVNRTFCVTVNHVETAFISAHLDNQVANVSWNTKTERYIGSPYTIHIDLQHNGETLIPSAINIPVASMSSNYYTLGKDYTLSTDEEVVSGKTYYSRSGSVYTSVTPSEGDSPVTEGWYEMHLNGDITFNFNGGGAIPCLVLDKVTNIPITLTTIYAGVSYERALTHTINRSEDTNVYELMPSPKGINIWKENGVVTISTNTLACGVRCTNSDDEPYMMTSALMTARGLSMVVQRKVNGVLGNRTAYTIGTALTPTENDEQFVFTLIDNNVDIDTQDVFVIWDGEDGKNYELRPSVSTINKQKNNTLNPTTLSFTAYEKIGEAAPAVFSGYIIAKDANNNTLGSPASGTTLTLANSALTGATFPIRAFLYAVAPSSGDEPLAVASVSLSTDGIDSRNYYVETDVDSVTIAANDTSVSLSCTAYFYSKDGANDKVAHSTHSWIYVRKGTTYTLVSGPGESTANNREISLDGTYINTNYDAVVIFIHDYPQSFNPASTYYAKKEIPIRKDGNTGQSSFKSTAFIRLPGVVTSVAAPTGGSYDSPIPTSIVNVQEAHANFSWSDGIPSGDLTLWATTRIFTKDGGSPQQSEWSTPRKMTDTSTYDVEFAKMQSNDATPAAPIASNRHGGSGTQIWFDPDLDSSEDFTAMYWRAEREYKNGEWSSWTILRIKGEKGDTGKGIALVETEYALGSSYTSAPNASSFSSDFPTMTNGYYVWMRQRYKYTDNTYSNWIYLCTTGKPGDRGNAGQSIRVRGLWNTSTSYENSADFIDVVLHSTDGTLYRWYKCEKSHTSGNTFSTTSGNDTVWSIFSNFDNLSTSVLLANQGYVDVLGAGRIWVGTNEYGNGVIGWLMTAGMIRHTGTGLTLTADGMLYDPDGLHIKVGDTVKKGLNLLPDPYFNLANRFSLRDGLQNGTTASPARTISTAAFSAYAYGLYCYGIHVSCQSDTASDRDIYTKNILISGIGHRIQLEPNTTYVFSLYSKTIGDSNIQDSSTYIFLYENESDTTYYSASKVPLNVQAGNELGRTYLVFSTGETALWFDFRLGINVKKSSTYSDAYFDAVKLEVGNVPSAMSNDYDNSNEVKKALLETGIDIENRQVRITADNFRVQNNHGDETMYVDKNGDVAIAGYLSEKVAQINDVDDWLNIFFPIYSLLEIQEEYTPEAGNVTVYGNNETLTRRGYPMITNNGVYDSAYFDLTHAIGKHWGAAYENYGMLDLCKCTGIINFEFQPRGAGGTIVESVIYLPWIQFNAGDACSEVELPYADAMAVRLAPIGYNYSGNVLFTRTDSEVRKYPPYTSALRHGAPTTGVAKATNLLPNNYCLYFNIQLENTVNGGIMYSDSVLYFKNQTGSQITLTTARIYYYFVTDSGSTTTPVGCNAEQTNIVLSTTNVKLYAYILINGTYRTNSVLLAEYNGYAMQFLRTITTFGNQPKHFVTYDEMLSMLGKRFVLHNNSNSDLYVIYDTHFTESGYPYCAGWIILPANTSLGFTLVQELTNAGYITTYKRGSSGNVSVQTALQMPMLYFKPDEADSVVIDFSRVAFNSANFGEQVYFED